ncbi:growth hormone secretagogue receptor type 1-like isoform X2 [Anneissia japonica]|uniref:growth hormone secretagogue receptor type 1-like isoform X2 n=1 Tax=Anneissia japonica TaxID=1529436 RepID=UPI001425B0A8|nr:growth hormone secretagogue receptor type 1-like isoform X2 [Anneissia japonica]
MNNGSDSIGVVGNLFVIVIFIRLKSMRTAPYVYLFTLAVVDMLFLLLMAPVQWIMYLSSRIHEDFSSLGVVSCKFYLTIQDFCVLFSAVIFTCVTIERYRAICHPMTLDKSKVSKRSTIACIVSSVVIIIYKIPTFTFATLAEYPILVGMNENITSHFPEFPDYALVCVYCNGLKTPVRCDNFNKTFYFDSFITVIIVPCVSTLYIIILIHLCNRQNISDTGGSSAHLTKMKIQSAIMIFVVLFLFIISTVPIRVFTFVYNLHANKFEEKLVSEDTLSSIIFTSRILIFLNSAANPIIYHIVSSKYRTAFRKGILFQNLRHSEKSYTRSRLTRETKLSIIQGKQIILD